MRNHYMSCYFNYCGYESRKRLTKEFCERYPQVHLIEYTYGDRPFDINARNTTQIRLDKFEGFMNNKAINYYISLHWNTIKSLTFIDSDIELPKHFFSLHEMKIKNDEPMFIQPFSYAEEISDQLTPHMTSCAKYFYENKSINMTCHTGYIHTYNRTLIENIGKFPECMVLGGFDTILFYCLFAQKEKMRKLVKNEKILKELESFYDRIYGTSVDYMACRIKHHFHGRKHNRYVGRFELYDDLSEESILKYFMSRQEDLK